MAGRLESNPHFRTSIVVAFGIASIFGFLWFWVKVGGHVPGIAHDSYAITFQTNDVNNLLPNGDVRMAGIDVGSVGHISTDAAHATVVIDLNKQVAPLHQGATVRIGLKSLIDQTYVDVVDGHGPALPSGSTLSDRAVLPAVQVQDVIAELSPASRQLLSKAVQSLGAATLNRGASVDQLATGLGNLGRGGFTAMQAIAAQSGDLKALTTEANQLINVLDTGQGQLAAVVHDANTITSATGGQSAALAQAVRQAPGVVDAAQSATSNLGTLADSLAPIAKNLAQAAPDLNTALLQLPSTTSDLQGLLPSLNSALGYAPPVLSRVPAFATATQTLIPGLRVVLSDADPMLAYLAPYGRDTGAMLTSFALSLQSKVENGVTPILLAPVFNANSVRNVPAKLLQLPINWQNAYPAPGSIGTPEPFRGSYPHVRRTAQ